MNFTYENQGTNTYLVYEIASDDIIDTMSLGMLTNNKISGLASAFFTQMDATKYIKYNVSAKISATQFFSGAVNKKRLLGVFKGIVNALLSAEDYMLDEKTILLDMDYIFADVSTCETVLICLPIEGEYKHHDLGVFFKNIMFSTQFDQTENCDHVAKIINYLNSTPSFSMTDFKELLDAIEKEKTSTVQPATTQAQVNVQPVVRPKVEVVNQQPEVRQQQPPSAPQVQPVLKKEVVQPQPVVPQPVQVPNQAQQKPVQQSVSAPIEKKMTMFSLLMHYSKENVEIYKAQKEAQKGTSLEVKPVKQQKKVTKVPSNGFAIPGQQAPNSGFAIPGQQTPTPVPVAQPIQSIPAPVQVPVAPVQQPKVEQVPVQQAPEAPKPAYVPRQAPQGQMANFGETTTLGGPAIGETSVLIAAQAPARALIPQLIRKKNNENIILNKPVFRVGKEKSYVDYFIGDNTAISRSHANIISRDGVYFVVDTNSTNHTFVNGNMIQSNVETIINSGDVIRLANEDFEFKLQ